MNVIEEVHQVCYEVYFRGFLASQMEKLRFFSLTVSSIDNQLYRSCVDVADIDPLLEQETWLSDVLVFLEVLTFPPGVFLSSGSKI